MSSLVGALRAMLSLDSTQFISGADKAQRRSKKLESGLASLSGTMRKVGIGLAAAAAGLGVAVKGQLNAADEMGKAAQKFGVGVEELSRLKYAADLSDVSLETLGGSLGQLSKKMLAARDGSKAQQKLFADLGVEVTDAAGRLRSAEVVMQDVAGVFATMPDGAEKTALAIKLFGKSGADMIPLLNSGKMGLKEMADEANRMGVVIDSKTAKSAESFNDNLTRLSAAAGGLVMQITAALAPTLEKLSEWAVDVANAFGDLSPETKEMVVQLGSILGVVGLAAAGFGLLSFAISPVSVAIAAIAAAAFTIKENWGPISAWFAEQWAGIKKSTQEAWKKIEGWIGGAIDFVQGKWDTFVASLKAAIQIAKDVAKAVKEAMTYQPGEGQIQNGTAPGKGPVPGPDWVQGGGGAGGAAGGQMFGVAIINGTILGAVEQLKKRQKELAAVFEGVVQTAKDVLQINSPSKVFHEIGQFLTEGLAHGITDGKPKVDTAMTDLGEAIEGKAESFKSAFESFRSTAQSAFSGLVTGAMNFKDAISQVIGKLAEMLAQSAFDGLMAAGGDGLLGGILKLLGFADGGVFQGGRVMAFANGGVVSGATAFAMQGGLGVMGEAGPEAIMPLARGRGGKLGVLAQGGGSGKLQIEITENPMFASRVEGIADGRAVQIVRKYDRDIAPQTRTRNPRERG